MTDDNDKTVISRPKQPTPKPAEQVPDDKTRIEPRPSQKKKEAAAPPPPPVSPSAATAETPSAGEADGTIIIRPAKPDNAKQAKAGAAPKPVVTAPAATPANKAKGKAAATPVTPAAAKAAAKPSSLPIYLLAGLAFLFIGLGSALTTIYLLSPQNQAGLQIADKDLEQNIVAVTSEASEAEDERLVREAIQPRILDLSGDPVVVRHLSNVPRQLKKLEKPEQLKAASDLGIKSDLYRLRDALDLPDEALQPGVLGSQDDIAVMQPSDGSQDSTQTSSDQETGSTVLVVDGGGERFSEYAEEVKANDKLGTRLVAMGLDAETSKQAEASFAGLYQNSALKPGDRLAVRAIAGGNEQGIAKPVQLSVYRQDALLGSIALNDVENFSRSEDPWFERDIFESPLLPDDIKPEDRPRLLDAIYAAALRNRIPAPVVGEMIMLLSRAQDLEQKVEPGDTITLIYTPAARDDKTGMGRIVFVSIGRTSGNLDCYPLQSKAGGAFDCVSTGGESSVEADGMVMPVNGVIVAKFGPQGGAPAAAADKPADGSKDKAADGKVAASKDAASKDAEPAPEAPGADNMNFGVDWTAPLGSPVVAAFAGDVTAVGQESGFGLVVRLTHPDDKTTMYAYLQRVQLGIAVGTKVTAGQVLGYVGTPPTSREPRLHFELRRAGVPVDPVADIEAPVSGGAGGAVDHFVHRIIYIESGNRCNAANPLSTAVGLGQFIESTWMTTIRLHRPDLLQGRTRREVLNMRTECNLARAMTTAFTRDNAAVIRRAGHNVTPGNLYLAHFLGVGGAVKVLRSDQNRQIAEVFGAHHVRANPFERGKSIGWLVSWAAKKMSGGVPKSARKIGSDTTKTASASARPDIKSAAAKPKQAGSAGQAAGAKPPAVKPAAAKPPAQVVDAAKPKTSKSNPKDVTSGKNPAKPGEGGKMPGSKSADAEQTAEANADGSAEGAAPAYADDGSPLAKSAGDPMFEKLKSAVLAFLQ